MVKRAKITAPERIKDTHDTSIFDSSEPSLDEWLRKRALKNEESGATRTFVICEGSRVIGYYALANGAVLSSEATGKVRRNMPDPVPVMLIGRLAIDKKFQGDGLGRELLADAVRRTVMAADIAGIRAIVVHAISSDAKLFYERCGFSPSPVNDMTLMITVKDAAAALS